MAPDIYQDHFRDDSFM